MAVIQTKTLEALTGSFDKHVKSDGKRGGNATTLKEYCHMQQLTKKPFPTAKRSAKQTLHSEIWALVDKAYRARSDVIDEAWRAYYFLQRKKKDTLQTPKKDPSHCQRIDRSKHISWFAYWMKKHLRDEMWEFYGDFIGLELVFTNLNWTGAELFFTVRVQQKDDFPTEEDLTVEHALRRT